MGTILMFDKARAPRRRTAPPQGGATIVLFSGVRYERQPERIDLSARVDSLATPADGGRSGTR